MRLTVLVTLLVLVLLAWLICPFQPAVVTGSSMEPTLHNYQVILIDKGAYQGAGPVRGDVVVFRHDGEILIKRILATEGEFVQDGPALLHNPGLYGRKGNDQAPVYHLYRVPVGQMYVQGDGVYSYDSRDFGPVPVKSIIGKVVLPHLPSTPSIQIGSVLR